MSVDLGRDGYLCFEVGSQQLGVPVTLVREINPHLDVTRIHTAPAFVRGLVNLRGQIVTVIDVGVRLGLGLREIGSESRLVVLKTRGELRECLGEEVASIEEKVGLLVDRILDVTDAPETGLESPPENLRGLSARLVTGVCATPEAAVAILDPRALLVHRELDS